MKTDMDIIAEQCAEIDRREGREPLPPVRSEPLLACTDAMLQAAVNKAVENGLFPKAGFCEVIAQNWRRMEECINAALQANVGGVGRREATYPPPLCSARHHSYRIV